MADEKLLKTKRESARAYRKAHPDRTNAANSKWRKKNRQKMLAADIRTHTIYRQAWFNYLQQRGLHKCSKCGYDKCFAAIDYHHENPQNKTKGKNGSMGYLFRLPMTIERIKELEKTIPLCRNCHAELHWGNGERCKCQTTS